MAQKVIGKGVVIGLSAILVILVVSNVYVYASMQNQIGGLNTDKTNLTNQATSLNNQLTTLTTQKNALNTTYQNYLSTHGYTNTQYSSLNTTYQNYKGSHSYTDSQYSTLNSQYNTVNAKYNTLNAPKLSSLSVSMSDNRPLLQTPYLHVTGEVWNVGNSTAYNSKIHVTLYQGAVVAQDTDISLGSILAENKVSVDQQVFYSGSALTSWSYSLTWTTS